MGPSLSIGAESLPLIVGAEPLSSVAVSPELSAKSSNPSSIAEFPPTKAVQQPLSPLPILRASSEELPGSSTGSTSLSYPSISEVTEEVVKFYDEALFKQYPALLDSLEKLQSGLINPPVEGSSSTIKVRAIGYQLSCICFTDFATNRTQASMIINFFVVLDKFSSTSFVTLPISGKCYRQDSPHCSSR